MRLNSLIILELYSAVVTYAAPFQVQDGELQRHRRRAVDYPVKSAADVSKPARKFRKRGASPYSVVQVDGESSTTVAPLLPATITVTQPPNEASASTQTIVVTSAVPGPTSDETISITTTQDPLTLTPTISLGVLASDAAATIVTTCLDSLLSGSASSSITANLSAPPSSNAHTPVDEVTSIVINTMMETITTTATTSSPTAYYDDGLWHTYYPVKTFIPPFATSTSAVIARAVKSIPFSHDASVVPSPQPGYLKNSTKGSSTSVHYSEATFSTQTTYARRWETPAFIASTATGHRDAHLDGAAYTSTPRAYAGTAFTQSFRDEPTYTTQDMKAHDFRRAVRKVPVDLKTRNWNITRTEMNGVRRFKN